MVAFLRRFLVMLLVMLQLAAPLVHAHVNDLGIARGLHLHEFETLQVKAEASLMAALDYACTSQSAIVEMGAAIKVPQPEKQWVAVGFWHAEPALPQPHVIETVNYSPHDPVVTFEPFLEQNSPRAPPA